jgi:3-hydroxy-9,10-secoandrosta-1,3,5(10)-triene-9,17-dione monooxygenase reductase component
MAQLDPKELRRVLGTFATGVTVITTRTIDGTSVGLTANSFNSVSLDPPMVLWSLAKTARSRSAFEAAQHWAVHILAADQEELANRFASRGTDKFVGLTLEQGLPPQKCRGRRRAERLVAGQGGDHQPHGVRGLDLAPG